MGDNVGDTSEDFWQTNKYVKIVWLLLKSLDKTGKENDELRDLNSQLKHHINDLMATMSALKETLISHNLRDEISDFSL